MIPNANINYDNDCVRSGSLLATEFDSIGHHVKKGKRGVCKQKAATVLPDRTAAI